MGGAGALVEREVHNKFSRNVMGLGYGFGDFIPAIRKTADEWRIEVALPSREMQGLNKLAIGNENFRRSVNERIRNTVGPLTVWGRKKGKFGMDTDFKNNRIGNIALDAIWTNDGIFFLINGGTGGQLTPTVDGTGYASFGIMNADAAVILFAALSVYMQELFKLGDLFYGKDSTQPLDAPLMVKLRPITEKDIVETPIKIDALPKKVVMHTMTQRQSEVAEKRGNKSSLLIVNDSEYAGIGDSIPIFDKTHNGYYVGMEFVAGDTLAKRIFGVNRSATLVRQFGDEFLALANESLILRTMNIEIKWGAFGPIIECSGNATFAYPTNHSGSYPDRKHEAEELRYSDHNVDSAMQTVALAVPLLMYLHHFYNVLDLEGDSNVGWEHFEMFDLIGKKDMLDVYDKTDYAYKVKPR